MMNDEKISARSAVMILLANGIGTGVLVLPRAMAAVGIFPMIFSVLIGGMVSGFTTWLLMFAVAKVTKGSNALSVCLLDGSEDLVLNKAAALGPSYGDLVGMAAGPVAALLLDIVLVLESMGALVTFFLFLADFIAELAFVSCPRSYVIIALALITYPVTLPRTIGKLANLASLPLMALSFMALAIWTEAPAAAEKRQSDVLAFNDLEKLPSVMCICVYAFFWHNNVVSIGRELRTPSASRCAVVAFGATSSLGIVYVVLALGGYWSWGDSFGSSASIIDKYSKDDILFVVVRVALIVSLLVTTPMNIFPVRDSCVSLLQQMALPGYTPSAVGRAVWSLGILVTVAGIAIAFPQVVHIITILGGTLTGLMVVVFPVFVGKLVFDTHAWLLTLVMGLVIGVWLNATALGFIGSSVQCVWGLISFTI